MADDESNKSGARDIDLDLRIANCIERGGMTAEERLTTVITTIDCALIRASNAVLTNVPKGSCAWTDLAFKMQAILANIDARTATGGKPQETVINLRFAAAIDEETTDGPDA